MNPSGPLRASLSRYRRHKLSLDGGTPGIEYPRLQGGHDWPPRSNEVGQRPAGTTYNNAPLPVIYDPGIGPYQLDTPAYDHPEPWHEAAASGAPWPPPSMVPSVPQQPLHDPPCQALAHLRKCEFVPGNQDCVRYSRLDYVGATHFDFDDCPRAIVTAEGIQWRLLVRDNADSAATCAKGGDED